MVTPWSASQMTSSHDTGIPLSPPPLPTNTAVRYISSPQNKCSSRAEPSLYARCSPHLSLHSPDVSMAIHPSCRGVFRLRNFLFPCWCGMLLAVCFFPSGLLSFCQATFLSYLRVKNDSHPLPCLSSPLLSAEMPNFPGPLPLLRLMQSSLPLRVSPGPVLPVNFPFIFVTLLISFSRGHSSLKSSRRCRPARCPSFSNSTTLITLSKIASSSSPR